MRRLLVSLGPAACVPLLLLVTSGCSIFAETRTCSHLAEVVDAGLGPDEGAKLGDNPDPKSLEAAAARYEALSRDVRAIDSKDETFERTIEAFAQSFTEVAAALRQAKTAASESNRRGYMTARTRLEQLSVRLGDQKKQIDKRCRKR